MATADGAPVPLRGDIEADTAAERPERWQTAYVPVYAGWAFAVGVLFPPMFGFA